MEEGEQVEERKWGWLKKAAWTPLALIAVVLLYFFLPVGYFALEAAGIISDQPMGDHLEHYLLPVEWLYQNFEPYKAFINAVRQPLVGR
ncbi:MAG: hypothetical protein HKN23_17905 [Verrucomicrobiales bacterium]|nr:hypothetical protein [Verrucomicrobiales bacterium]